MAEVMTPDLPFEALPATVRRLSRPERRIVHRLAAAVLDGTIQLPRGFVSGQELTHLHAATEKIEVRRRRKA